MSESVDSLKDTLAKLGWNSDRLRETLTRMGWGKEQIDLVIELSPFREDPGLSASYYYYLNGMLARSVVQVEEVRR